MKKDLIIIGAGLIGTSLAVALADSGLEIAVLEKHLPDFSVVNHDRPISLTYGSQQLLQRLGIWQALADTACPIEAVHVTEQGRFGVLHFTAAEFKVPALGYVVSYNKLHQALYTKMSEQKNVTLIHSHEIEKCNRADNQLSVHYQAQSGEKLLQAGLVVAADGAESKARELMGLSVARKKHAAKAIIANLDLSTAHHNIGFERFTQQGTLAILPLFNPKQSRLVWTLNDEQAKTIDVFDDKAFLHAVQATFKGRLAIAAVHKTAEFPLQTIIAKTQIAANFVVLGNAAHAIFPVAAQGFNLGLRDVNGFCQVLEYAKRHDIALHDFQLLQKYVALRKPDQQRILKLTHRTVDLFDLDLPGLGALRGLGLLATNMLMPLKARLAKRLMGAS